MVVEGALGQLVCPAGAGRDGAGLPYFCRLQGGARVSGANSSCCTGGGGSGVIQGRQFQSLLFFLSCLTALLHEGQSRTFQNYQHIQDVIFFSVQQAAQVESPCMVLEDEVSHNLPCSLNCTALNTEAKIGDDRNFIPHRQHACVRRVLVQLSLIGCEKGEGVHSATAES